MEDRTSEGEEKFQCTPEISLILDILTREIASCTDDNQLFELTKPYLNHFICCCEHCLARARPSSIHLPVNGQTLVPSHNHSQPTFDDAGETLGYLIKNAPRGHQTSTELINCNCSSRSRGPSICDIKQTLICDGYQCTMTEWPNRFLLGKLRTLDLTSQTGGVVSSKHVFTILRYIPLPPVGAGCR